MRKGIAALVAFLGLSFCMNLYFFDVFEGKYLPHGSYLMIHSRMPPKIKERRVLLMGNSVFQFSPVVREMRLLRNKEKGNTFYEIGNFGYVGSSIMDHLFTYLHIRQFEPDMLLIHLSPGTFDSILLRTDLKNAIFLPTFNNLLNFKQIRNEYTRDEAAENLLYSYFPPLSISSACKV